MAQFSSFMDNIMNMSSPLKSGGDKFFKTLNQKLEPPVKSHLKQVYSTLALATFVAGIGSYIQLFTNIWGLPLLAALGSIGFTLALAFSHDNGKNTERRLYYLLGFAACVGVVLGPMIDVAIALNPRILPMTFISTCLVFGSFSLSSIFSTHNRWLYMTGGMMSMLSVITFLSIANLFIGSHLLYQVQLYLGLIVFCLFVMFDTAVIIEKRRMGDTDHIKHAMLLFCDFVDIFRTILVLLIRKERSRENSQSRSRR